MAVTLRALSMPKIQNFNHVRLILLLKMRCEITFLIHLIENSINDCNIIRQMMGIMAPDDLPFSQASRRTPEELWEWCSIGLVSRLLSIRISLSRRARSQKSELCTANRTCRMK